MPRTFYRIVVTDPPSLTDFLSDKARGKSRPTDPGKVDLYDGLSVYATLTQARRKALDLPMLGRFVAELGIPDRAPVRAGRTVRGSRGYHTLWAEPEVLLAHVVAVVPVLEEGE